MHIEEKKKIIEETFGELKFNEKRHIYTVNGKRLTSVSKAIKKYYKPFELERMARIVAKARGVSAAEIKREWNDKKEAACNRGNAAHLFGENYREGMKPRTGLEKAVVKFWDDVPNHIILVYSELKMFLEELGLAGTGDIILYNLATNKFIIADYKTNEDLFKNYKGKKMIGPFSHLLDNNFNKYQIQLSFYQILLEQLGSDFQVESRRNIWLQDDGTYKMYKTEDFTSILLADLKN
jgi:hypothetical protein